MVIASGHPIQDPAPNSAASRGVERVDAVPGAMNHLRPIHSTAATNYAD